MQSVEIEERCKGRNQSVFFRCGAKLEKPQSSPVEQPTRKSSETAAGRRLTQSPALHLGHAKRHPVIAPRVGVLDHDRLAQCLTHGALDLRRVERSDKGSKEREDARW